MLHVLTIIVIIQGLKKLGTSIELSYSNILKLVLRSLQSVCACLIFHVKGLVGLARWKDSFADLGLDETRASFALDCARRAMLKAVELQQ